MKNYSSAVRKDLIRKVNKKMYVQTTANLSYTCQVCGREVKKKIFDRQPYSASTSEADTLRRLEEENIKSCTACHRVMCDRCSQENFCLHCSKLIPKEDKKKYQTMIGWKRSVFIFWIVAIILIFFFGLAFSENSSPFSSTPFKIIFWLVVVLGFLVSTFIWIRLTGEIYGLEINIAISLQSKIRDGGIVGDYQDAFITWGKIPSVPPTAQKLFQNPDTNVDKKLLTLPLEPHEKAQIPVVKQAILKIYQERPDEFISIFEIGMKAGDIDVDVVRRILETMIENFDITAKFDEEWQKIKLFKIY